MGTSKELFVTKRKQAKNPLVKLYYEILSRFHVDNIEIALQEMSEETRIIMHAIEEELKQNPDKYN